MLESKEFQIALNKFAKDVISRSRANLTNSGKNVSRKLYDSLDYELDPYPNSFKLSFKMEEYASYQDKGVKGANPSLVKNGIQKAPNSPYSFKSKMPPTKFIEEWAKKKNIRLRDDKGKFKKGTYNTIGYILSKRIFAQGIKPSLFFTKPFESAFEKLPDELVEKYGLDVETFLKFTLERE